MLPWEFWDQFFIEHQWKAASVSKSYKSYLIHFPTSLVGSNVVSTQYSFLSHWITLPLLEGWWTSFPSFSFTDNDKGSTPVLFKVLSASTFSNVNSHTGWWGSRKVNNLIYFVLVFLCTCGEWRMNQFKNGPIKIFGSEPLKNLKWCGLLM